MLRILLWASLLLLAACSVSDLGQDDGRPSDYLKVNAAVGLEPLSRAVYMHGNILGQHYFLNGSHIGITVVKADDESAYNGGHVNNHWYCEGIRSDTYNGQEWMPVGGQQANGVGLNENGAKVCAYYPYNAGYSDLSKMHWRCNPYVDIMYAKWTLSNQLKQNSTTSYEPVCRKAPTTDLNFQHAQAVIVFVLRNKGYNNQSRIYSVNIHSDGFGREADLNAGTGELSNVTDTIISETYDPPLTFKLDSTIDMFYVFPKEKVSPIYFSFDIDHEVQSGVKKDLALQQGYVYYFHFYLSSVRLYLSDVEIVPWDQAGILADAVEPYDYRLDTARYVDMDMTDVYGNKILWAANNLGAADSMDIGDYYMWGDTVPFSGTHWVGPSYYTKLRNLGWQDIGGTPYDAARHVLGNENRMPTRTEWQMLTNPSKYTWTVASSVNRQGNTVYGYRVSLVSDPSRAIFLPYGGYRAYKTQGTGGYKTDTIQTLNDVNAGGRYWTSSHHVDVIPYQPQYFIVGTGATSGYNTSSEIHGDSVAYNIRPVKVYRRYKPPFK